LQGFDGNDGDDDGLADRRARLDGVASAPGQEAGAVAGPAGVGGIDLDPGGGPGDVVGLLELGAGDDQAAVEHGGSDQWLQVCSGRPDRGSA